MFRVFHFSFYEASVVFSCAPMNTTIEIFPPLELLIFKKAIVCAKGGCRHFLWKPKEKIGEMHKSGNKSDNPCLYET